MVAPQINHTNNLWKNATHNRLLFLFFCWIVFGLIIIARLFQLQILGHASYYSLAAKQHDIYKKLLPKRGEIFFQDSNATLRGMPSKYGSNFYPVAVNRDYVLVWTDARQVKDKTQTAKILSQILGLSEQEILDKLSTNLAYIVLKRKISSLEEQSINNKKLAGIYTEKESLRYYPSHNIGSHLLGFVGHADDGLSGRYGIEYYFNNVLAGENGFLRAEKDPSGTWISLQDKETVPAINGDDLILTIDYSVQLKTCNELSEWVKKYQAEGGTVIISEVKTGAILAMCSVPDYDPNDYGKVTNPQLFKNPAIADQYEPGSIFKPITMASALDLNYVQPNTTYEDIGTLKIGGYKIQNSDYKTYGEQTMTQVLEKSLNTGAVFVANQIGNKALQKYVNMFGFGVPTEITLNGEAKGDIRALDKKSEIYLATASFGQGISVTPIQMLMAYGAIANDGKLMKPYIVKEIRKHNGEIIKTTPEVVRTSINASTAHVLSAMLTSVVDNGHGKRAGVNGYYIAGKTGTAQVAKKDSAGYEKDKLIGSFVGFGSMYNPKFVMLVKIDNPQGVRFAESSAAPLFGKLAKFLLNYYEMAPERK